MLLGFIFVASAIPKLLDPRWFSRVIASYGLVPGRTVRPLAVMLGPCELVLGFALLAGWQSRLVGICAAIVLLGFAAAVGINVARGSSIDCGCGGWDGPVRIGWSVVAGDLLFASFAGAVALAAPSSIAKLLEQNRVSALDLVALALCAVLVLIAVSLTRSLFDLRSVSQAVVEALAKAQSL